MEAKYSAFSPIELDAEQLFKAYYAKLCFFAFQHLGDKQEAEDLAQEAFMAYLKKRNQLSKDTDVIRSFLYSSVKNACYNTIRRQQVIRRYFKLREDSEVEEAKYLTSMIRTEVLAAVYKIIDDLPEGCREIFRMGYLEGLNNQEISEKLGVTINTVKTQKQRGMKVLKRKLDPEMFTLLLYFFFSAR
ncbi:RNA polymerase sigma-70 factor [Olivibacter sp. SDN3]|uniref:RNA polymerase sigma-70 factor n=1 Tax=Olivibacter sp. SDN3 TaxID=2764720 RepID=UPI0016518E3C|nr:RNA polymerase sigma-70 factor [Olivibacter sp. SDN3]QNL50763.1 RNA polymerase sigma-70 factor [Olivibacter sp. SDN3]